MKTKYSLLTRLILFFLLCAAGYSWAETSYTVKRGDSLYTIAQKFNISVAELKEFNQLPDSKIKAGERLLIPESPTSRQISAEKKKKEKTSTPKDDLAEDIPETHTVKKGETLRQIARRYQLDVQDLKEINQLPGDKLKAGQVLYLQKSYHGEEERAREEEKREITRIRGIGFFVTEKDRELLGRVAKSFLGLRYVRGGTSINGLDCSAFVQKIYRIFGIELPRTTREQFQIGYAVSRSTLRQGDLVFFKRGQSRQPAHVGIYLGNNQFIHTSLSKGRVEIDNLENKYFASHFIGARRVEEIIEKPGGNTTIHVHIGNPWE